MCVATGRLQRKANRPSLESDRLASCRSWKQGRRDHPTPEDLAAQRIGSTRTDLCLFICLFVLCDGKPYASFKLEHVSDTQPAHLSASRYVAIWFWGVCVCAFVL